MKPLLLLPLLLGAVSALHLGKSSLPFSSSCIFLLFPAPLNLMGPGSQPPVCSWSSSCLIRFLRDLDILSGLLPKAKPPTCEDEALLKGALPTPQIHTCGVSRCKVLIHLLSVRLPSLKETLSALALHSGQLP